MFSSLSALTKEAKVLCRELTQVREHSGQQVRRQTVPGGQRCAILIDGCRRYPTTPLAAVVVWSVDVEGRIRTIESATQNCATHDERMTAPGMIRSNTARASSRRLERAAKIRNRKQGRGVAVALKSHLVIKRAGRLTELSQQITLIPGVVWLRR